MNSHTRIPTLAAVTFLCAISSLSIAQTNESFFEKIESIKKDLYKLSASELYKFLDISPLPISTITADQLQQEMSTSSKLLVINVLPEYYHNDCHITGSINVPLPELVGSSNSWDRSQKIVLYCALTACDAGEKGCILLHRMGFTNVIDYKGGIKEWYQLGYPTQGSAISDYLHTRWLAPSDQEYLLYPETLVCSNQTRWISRYQKQ